MVNRPVLIIILFGDYTVLIADDDSTLIPTGHQSRAENSLQMLDAIT